MNELTNTRSTVFPHRLLTRTEHQLVAWLGQDKEREAVALAALICDLPAHATDAQIADAVLLALCSAYCGMSFAVEYLGGRRLDIARRIQ